MAIQVGGTTVVSNTRGLNNIASVDAATVAAFDAAGVGSTASSIVVYASDPSGASEGDIYYNSTSDVLRVFSDGAWVNVSNTAPSIAGGTVTIPDAQKDLAASYNLGEVFTDDSTPDSDLGYIVASGTLPAGLSMPSSGSSTITGTPTTAATYNFSVTATDASGSTSLAQPFIWTVTPPPFVSFSRNITTTGVQTATIPWTGLYRIVCIGAGGSAGAGTGGVGGTSISYIEIDKDSVIEYAIGEPLGAGPTLMRGGTSPNGGQGGGGSYVKLLSGSSNYISGFGSFLCVGGGGGGAGYHAHTHQWGGSGNGGGGSQYATVPKDGSYAQNGGIAPLSDNSGAPGSGSTILNQLTGGNGGFQSTNYGGAGGGGYGGGAGASSGQNGIDGQAGGYTSEWQQNGVLQSYMRGGAGGGSHPNSCGGSGGGGGGWAAGPNAVITQQTFSSTSASRPFGISGSIGDPASFGGVFITNDGI